MGWRRPMLVACVLVCALTHLADAKKKKKKVKVFTESDPIDEVHSGPVEFCVWDKDLVATTTKTKHVIEHHAGYHKETDDKHFGGASLAYVTPWNGKGYDVAKQFKCKFTHISPVWFQLRMEGKNLQISGGHDVDKGWMEELRQGCEGKPPRILPRFLSEIEPRQLLDYLAFPQALIKPIFKEIKAHGMDGLVLECWTQWAAMGLFRQDDYRQAALRFIQQMGKAAKEEGLDFVLAVPPAVSPQPGGLTFSRGEFEAVREHVTGVSLMTYDYSFAESPGPNAPFDWVEKNLMELLGDAGSDGANKWGPKVWAGLNFYGRAFYPSMGTGSLPGNDAVVGHEYTKVLQEHRPKLEWDPRAQEHSAKYKRVVQEEPHQGKQQVVTLWYPTLQSVHARLELAQRYSAGISIWEIGQGLDYFYDLL